MIVNSQIVVETNTSHFSKKSIDSLKRIMYTEEYQRGSSVFWEGERNNHLYFLIDGRIKLTKLNEAGKDLTLSVYFPGDLFGDFDPTREQLNSFTAQADEDSKIGIIQQSDMEWLLKEEPKLAADFTKWQSQLRRYTQLKLRDLLLYGKNGALASTLVRAANTYGITQSNDIILISEKITNYDLANLIGATRETVNRLLSGFEKNGLIKTTNGRIEIFNLAGLKEINRCENCNIDICRL